jgi:alpha-mannosidase
MEQRRTFHLILHTHWDREWYLPRAAFVARLVPMLDDLVTDLEREPDFRSFLLDGQTIHLEDYLRIRPDRREAIRALVEGGRLQVGPWYVLADELIPSGESLVRNLLLGQRDAAALGGRLDVLYSPDAFGHPAAWPALAAEFGIRFGVLWRGLDGTGQTDLVRWRAADGRDTIVYHLPPDGYEIGSGLGADPERLPAEWAAIRDGLVERAGSTEIAVFVGADHHAAHPDVTRLRERIAEQEPDAGVRVSRLDEFLEAAAASAHAVPEIAGELRWSYGYTWTLQGVHGTRAPLKRRNARTELALERFAEPLAALARRSGGRDRAPLLAGAWRALVRAHFHDSIGGCSHDAVARAMEGRFADAAAVAREISITSLAELIGHDADRARDTPDAWTPALAIWNPAARPRGGIVVADATFFRGDVLVGPPGTRRPRRGPGYRPFTLAGPDGTRIPVQVIAQSRGLERLDARRHYPDQDAVDRVRVAFRVPELPGLGTTALALDSGSGKVPAGDAWARAARVGNDVLEVAVTRGGALAVIDRRTGERYGGLLRLESERDEGDTYTVATTGPVLTSSARVATRVLARGPLVAAVEARWDALEASVAFTVIVHADDPLVRCIIEVDNRGADRRLRARLPLGLAGTVEVAGGPFTALRRGALDRSRPFSGGETPVATAPAQRFVAASSGPRGLALFAPGHFEYEWTAAGDLIVTILRSVGELSKSGLPTRDGHAGWPTPTPGAQCVGRDRIELALAPVGDDETNDPSALARLWEDAMAPLTGRWLRDATDLALVPAAVELEGEGLILSAVKPADDGDGIILRCWNGTAARRKGAWRIVPPAVEARRCRADEVGGGALPLEHDGTRIPFDAGPHEIVTIRIR